MQNYFLSHVCKIARCLVNYNLLGSSRIENLTKVLSVLKELGFNFKLEDSDLEFAEGKFSEETLNKAVERLLQHAHFSKIANSNISAVEVALNLSKLLFKSHLEEILTRLPSHGNMGGTLLYGTLCIGNSYLSGILVEKNMSLFPPGNTLSDRFNSEITKAVANYILDGPREFLSILDKPEYYADVKKLSGECFDLGYTLWAYIGHILVFNKKVNCLREFIERINLIKPISNDTLTMNANKQDFRMNKTVRGDNEAKFRETIGIIKWYAAGSEQRLRQAFLNAFVVLGNVSLCCEILAELDEDIRKTMAVKESGIDYSKYKSDYLFMENLFFPDERAEHLKTLPKKDSLLSLLLLMNEQKHGININSQQTGVYPVPCFVGYVSPKLAVKIVRAGHLFSEYSVLGNNLAHGKYTHRIQWYILMKAFAAGKLDLCGFTIKELLIESVSSKKLGVVPWSILIDSVYHRESNFAFYSVHAANSFLLTTNDSRLQNLRGYLLLNFWATADKINKFYPELSYRMVVLLNASPYRDFTTTQYMLGTKYVFADHEKHIASESDGSSSAVVWKKNKDTPGVVSRKRKLEPVQTKLNRFFRTV